MAEQSKNLSARPREERGKGAARKLRGEGRIPAVVYGHGEETRALSVDSRELENLFAHISVENTLITLEVEGEKKGGVQALVREVQNHPHRREVLHVDFYQVHEGESIELEVPVRLVGSAVGVREGGILEQPIHDLPVRCLPSQIPEVIELDVSHLEIGDSLHVGDLSLPEGVETDLELDRTVCAVSAPSILKVEEEEEAEVPEVPEGVGGEVEPELIRKRQAEEGEGGEAEEAEEG